MHLYIHAYIKELCPYGNPGQGCAYYLIFTGEVIQWLGNADGRQAVPMGQGMGTSR